MTKVAVEIEFADRTNVKTAADQLLELHRSRWRRYREGLQLCDTASDTLIETGLARHVAGPRVRFLVLPADPEHAVVAFDGEFWSWWKDQRKSPFPAQVAWGYDHHPTGEAAVTHDGVGDDRWAWDTYLAVHRHGGLEFAMGQSAVYEWRDRTVFRLIQIVGRLWHAINLYGAVLDRFSISGPWEVTLALRGTSGALLGNVAQGWAEPGEGAWDVLPCPERNLLFRREIEDWPTGDSARELAFEVGSAVDESWGSERPRFIARRGPTEGEFDWQMFRG